MPFKKVYTKYKLENLSIHMLRAIVGRFYMRYRDRSAAEMIWQNPSSKALWVWWVKGLYGIPRGPDPRLIDSDSE
jgi:hypothetical protein